jgi:hypothetical protein
MSQETELLSIESVLEQAAKAGITVTPDHLAEAELIKQERFKQLQESEAARDRAKSGFQRVLDGFLARYPALQDGLIKMGNLVMAITQTVAVAFGVPTILFIAVIAEYTRVLAGIKLFEVHHLPAILVAITLVSSNLVLKFVIHYRESKEGYVQPTAYEFSLKIAWEWLRYKLGYGSTWQARPKSPAHIQRALLSGVSSAILALALTGSMEPAILKSRGDWIGAIGSILTQSSLQEIVMWGLSIITAFVLVHIVQIFGEYVAHAVADLVKNGSVDDNKLDKLAAVAGATALLGIVKDLKNQRRLASAQTDGIKEQAIKLPMQSDAPMRITDASMQKKPIDIAREWLEANPEHGLSYRKAAREAGVSESAMQRAMKH